MDNKISIVVPIYNLQNYIERCVKSILEQTYNNFEVILVDDGSSDNSWGVIKKLAQNDKRIIILKKENGGVTSARLAGIEKATGEWIGFVDGDDEIEKDMYEVLMNNALKYQADISHCGYQMCFRDGRVNCFYNTGNVFEQDSIKGVTDLLEGTMVEPGLCNKLFRKSLIDKLALKEKIPNDIKINEDLLMNYYLFSESKKSVFEDVCKYHYIVRENSASRAKLNEHKIFDPIKVKKIILENSNHEWATSAKKAYISTCINVYNGLVLEPAGEYKRERNEIRQMIIEKKGWSVFLSKKRKMLLNMICCIPIIYPTFYKIYVRLFMKNKYD